MTSPSGYSTRGSSAGPITAAGDGDKGYWKIDKLKRAYSDYLTIKQPEIEEAKEARRYYHGAQWTDEQIKILKKRKQPIATINRISRKIDGTVGTIVKMRQDPKAYPRNPQHEQGADLATAVIRYALDEGDWRAKDAEAARDCATEGIAGLEINIIGGDTKDPNDKDIDFDIVEPDSFFYDPRSYRADFTDAEFMGVGKWYTTSKAIEMFPDKKAELESSVDGDGDSMTSQPDRDQKWFSSDRKYIRIVDCWYQHKGGWCYAIHTGSVILMEGESYLKDEKEHTECKYVMFSCNVDHDGDRYGFVRNMKSQQDGINFKEAKLHHILGSRRLKMVQGAVDDIEKTRTEWARPDGIIVENIKDGITADDQQFDFVGWSQMLKDAKEEIENFGINPAVLGQGVEKQSGRAINLLQQAGIAELGPYIIAYRGWKLRFYRIVFNAIQRHWTGERWIRVTDDEQVAQFVQINGTQIDPMTGHPQMVNAIGSLDVDIIIDEGPDTINQQAASMEVLQSLGPQFIQQFPEVAIELSPLDSKTKTKMLEKMKAAQDAAAQKPDPEMQKAQMKMEADKQTAALQIEQKAKEFELEQQAEAAKADQEMKLEQAKAEQEMVIKQREAELELEIERRKAEQQLEVERIRASESMQVEREKAAQGLEVEKVKGDMSLSVAKQQHQMKADSEKPKKPEKDPAIDAVVKGLKSLAEDMSEMKKLAKAPRVLVRDKNGRPERSVVG